ncbi:MAG: hypothetical protein LBL13_05915 [Bacteroidales bacterium]|jgi:ribosomal protein L32|nr:hypothetical protein [Bacteroidales bacterium]
METLTCPNCGAAATNHRNCEYCGSLLVRFVDKNINLVNTEYLNNSKVLPGLIEELEENLRLQRENSSISVVTDINREISTGQAILGNRTTIASVLSSLQTSDGKVFFPEADDGRPHLMIAFMFDSESGGIVVKNEQKRFENLDCIDLFTRHKKVTNMIYNLGIFEYAIDFGEDVEGAARIISTVLRKVFKVNNSTELQYYTVCGDNLKEIEKKRDVERNWYEQYKWHIAIGATILFFLIRCAANS